MTDATKNIDRTLAETAASLNFLLAVTPVNAAAAYEEFVDSGCRIEPHFEYRPKTFGAAEALHRLGELNLREIENSNVRELLYGKRKELIAQIEMIRSIDTPHFHELSLELYGGVDDGLLEIADLILAELPPPESYDPRVRPDEMAARARAELDRYCAEHPDLACTVEVRDDVVDLMVSQGKLLIGAASNFRAERVEALIHHEIGVHVVTYYNACFQPYDTLRVGLAGYEQTQEGFALLAEHLVDGLDTERMRVLAARVVAVRRLLDGASFVEIFGELRERGFIDRSAWSVVSRVCRAGGLTKDAMYLRGLIDVMTYLRDGGSMGPLLVGKIALDHVPAIEELLSEGVLQPSRIVPHWLQLDDIDERLDRVRRMDGPLGLVAREVMA